MKKKTPFSWLVIPAGIVVMALAVVLVLNLDGIVRSVGAWLFGSDTKPTMAFFYCAAFLIPAASGFLMCLVLVLVFRREDREYEEQLRSAAAMTDDLYAVFRTNMDSINDSISRLRTSTRHMGMEAERLSKLGRHIREERMKRDGIYIHNQSPVDFETYHFRPVNEEYEEAEIFPPEPFWLPRFHQKE
jgi:hypothetical protein